MFPCVFALLSGRSSFGSAPAVYNSPIMHPLQNQVAAYADRYGLLPRGAHVVVAVSGGPDSLCLLHVLRALAAPRELELLVAHLDHRLRPESAGDARHVQHIAETWGLPVVLGSEDVAAYARRSKAGVEAAARELRYRFLAKVAHDAGARLIALGQHADDQAETVLLRLLRGAGPSGLAAMRPRRPLHSQQREIMVVRPLLEARRDDIEAYCRAHGIPFLRDTSNEQPIYARNRVRGYILPLLKTYNSNIVATLARTARICAEEDELVDGFVDRAWHAIAERRGAEIVLDRPGFAELHPALRRRVLRRAVAEIEPQREVEARHIDLALDAIGAGRRRMQLPGGLWLRIEPQVLRLGRRAALDGESGAAGGGSAA